MTTMKKAKLYMESRHGVHEFDGWADDENYWNGWSYVLMNRENADKVAEVCDLKYDKQTDTYTENDPEPNSWTGKFNEELNEHVYDIGSGYWIWQHDIVEDENSDK